MRNELVSLDMYGETGSLSGVIVRILSIIGPVIKREHKWGEQRDSRYKYVSRDPDEVRDHAHTYLPEKVYTKTVLT